MKILVVGGGGREHAIIKKLKEDARAEKIFALPGNGGIAADAVCLGGSATDIPAAVAAAKRYAVDFVVVAPDDPLALGMVDELEAEGFACFGPRKNAAVIESSKAFSKDLMKKYGIPTAAYEIFTELDKALAYVDACPLPVVVKADGLALGKGVLICETREAAREAVRSMMEDRLFGDSGATVVIEEFLTGPEVSVLSFTDGETVVPMVSCMDHKRALDGDQGLNTGGMGTIAPNLCYTSEIAAECMEKIFLPTIRAMKAEGRPFKGCLYFGLMLTAEGPKVIEYNCRFGDPETQVALPLLESSLLEIMLAVSKGTLAEAEVKFSEKSACCVILASKGYPEKYEKGFPITLPAAGRDESIYIAGAVEKDGKLLTSGGRVLGAAAVAENLPAAVERAYALADRIHFDNACCRRDIGRRAMKALEEKK